MKYLINRFKDFKNRFNNVSEVLDENNINELKDIFVDLTDEFNLDFYPLDGVYSESNLLNQLFNTLDSNLMVYGSKIQNSEDIGDYIFFAVTHRQDFNDSKMPFSQDRVFVMKFSKFSNQVYSRILSMGYKCEINMYTVLTDSYILYRIGKDSKLKNINIFK